MIFVRFKAEFRFFLSPDFTVLPLRFLFYSIFNTSDFADFRFFVVLVKSGLIQSRGCRGRDCMVFGFTTTYAVSAYHH